MKNEFKVYLRSMYSGILSVIIYGRIIAPYDSVANWIVSFAIMIPIIQWMLAPLKEARE